MTLAFLYWFFVLLLFLFGGWWSWRPNGDRLFFGWAVIWLLLLIIIGLRLFGSPIQG